MKINFDSSDNYIVIKPSENSGKVLIILSARNHLNTRTTTINSAEITIEQLAELIKPLGFKQEVVEPIPIKE